MWFPAKFFIGFEIIVNRFLEGGAQFRHRLAMEPYNVPDAGNMPNKASVFVAGKVRDVGKCGTYVSL